MDWKQYEMMALTTRWSTDFLLKTNIFYYAVTGAILSFYFSRPAPQPWSLKFVLILPVLLGVVLGAIFIRSARTTRFAEMQIRAIAKRLGLLAWPDTQGLKYGFVGSAVLVLFIAAALIVIMALEDYLGLRRS